MAKSPASAPAEDEAPAVSTAIVKSVSEYLTAQTKLDIAFDKIRTVAKSESVKHSYTEKQLTGILLEAGLDPARASEVKGFVFPAHNAARKELDRAMEHNANQTDAKKRIAKPVILALQRDKTGTLTLKKAQEAHKAANTLTRTPGGQTDQTDKTKPAKKKTAKEIEEELGNLVAAALNFAKANEYDMADFQAVVEAQAEEIFSDDEDESEEDEDESED